MATREISQQTPKDEAATLSIEAALASVRKALSEIRYGEVTIKVEGGKVIWVDKHERERVG